MDMKPETAAAGGAEDVPDVRRERLEWATVEEVIVGIPPRMDTLEERVWLPAARRGERWALEHFYAHHQPRLYALCYRLLGREEDAQDAMQAAFVQAFRALPGFRGDSAARTWLFRIAVNQAMTILRRRGAAPLPMEFDMPVPDGAPAVTERLAVRAAMARLSPEHRAVLTLRYWESLAYDEIATVLGLPMPTVKMRLKRARDAFRRHYDAGS